MEEKNYKIIPSWALVSNRSGNIPKWDELCSILAIFETKRDAEIVQRKFGIKKYKLVRADVIL